MSTDDPQQQQPDGDVSEEPQYNKCCWYMNGSVLICFTVALLLGATNSFTSAIFADLATDTFHNSSFEYTGIIGGCKSTLIVCYTPIMGSLTDTYGRKPILMAVIAVTTLSLITMVIFNDFLAYLLVDAVFGLLMPAMYMLFAIVSDLVPAINRSRTICTALCLSLYTAMMPVSFIGNKLPTRGAFACSLVACVLAFLVVWWKMPKTGMKHSKHIGSNDVLNNERRNSDYDVTVRESDPLLQADAPSVPGDYTAAGVGHDDDVGDDHGAPPPSSPEEAETEENKASIAHHASRAWHLLRCNKNIRLLVAIAALNMFDQAIYSQAAILYMKDTLGMTKNDLSVFMLVGAAGSVCFSFTVIFIGHRLHNVPILIVALVGNAAMAAGYAFVKSILAAQLLILGVLLALAATPTVSSLAAQAVDNEHFGVVQGVLASARTFAQAVAPFVFGGLFQVAKGTAFPGWPFLIGTGLAIVAIVFACFLQFDTKKEDAPTEESAVESA